MATLQRPVRVRKDGKHQPEHAAAVIDLDEFQEARRDPKWRKFVEEAKTYRESLRKSGRSS